MEAFTAVLLSAAIGMIGWTLREVTRIGRSVARIQFALFGDGKVDEDEPVLPLVQAVAELRKRVRATEELCVTALEAVGSGCRDKEA